MMAKRIDTQRKQIPASVGAPGLLHYGGYIQSEWDRRLQGLKGPQVYREMAESDASIGALLFAIEALVRSTGYRVEPADESTQAQEEADFVESCFEDMEGAWGDTLSEILTLIPYGFSLFELVYKVRRGDTDDLRTMSAFDDNRIGWARWAPRSQETILRWEIRDDGTTEAAYQTAPPNYREVTIPLSKCLHFRAKTRRQNPEGLSLLRNCFDAWYFKKHIARIEAIGIERDLAGLPKVSIPNEVIAANGPELKSWQAVATNLRRDEQAGVIVPSDRDEQGNPLYNVELLSTGGERSIDTDKVIARYERWILRALLADFLTLGDQGVGSYAQSVNRSEIFLTAVGSIVDGIADVINAQAIRTLMRLNGVPNERWPRFTFNELDTKDIKSFAETVATLVTAGIVDPSEPDLKQTVYDMVGLPLAQETLEEEQEAASSVESETKPKQEDGAVDTDDVVTQDDAEAKAAMEPLRVDDELMANARKAWRQKMRDTKYGGLLDAEVA